MSSKLSQESQRRSVTGAAPPSDSAAANREMPVLFRLQDVNHRPPAPRMPPPAAAPAFVPAALPPANLNVEPERPTNSLPEAPFSAFAPAPLAISIPAPAVPQVAAAAATASIAAEPVAQAVSQSAVAATDTAAEPLSSTAEKSAGAPSLTIAQRRQQRAEANKHKAQPAKPKDWFSSHLHLVAVGFVIALGATIYIARNGRQEEEEPVAGPEITWEMEYPGDAAGAEATATASSPPSSASPAASVAVSPAAGASETSPAPVHELAAANEVSAPTTSPAEQQVSLLTPTVPLTATTGGAPSDARDPLFTWKGDANGSVAANPATPTTAPPVADNFQNPGAVTNPYARRAAETAAATPPPASYSQQPQPQNTAAMNTQPQQRSPYILPNSPQDTLSPPGGSPYAPPAAAYTAAAPQYSAQPYPAPQAPAYQPAATQPPLNPPAYGGSSAPGNAMPPNYSPAAAYPPASSMPAAAPGYPNTQTPNGYRYERSGSGLY